jgi:hypothetical protein
MHDSVRWGFGVLALAINVRLSVATFAIFLGEAMTGLVI